MNFENIIQISYNKEDKDINDVEIIEIGPRFALNPIKIFDDCMKGAVLYSNEFYVSPNKVKIYIALNLI